MIIKELFAFFIYKKNEPQKNIRKIHITNVTLIASDCRIDSIPYGKSISTRLPL